MATATLAVAREVTALKEWVTTNLSMLKAAGVTKLTGTYQGVDDDGFFNGLALEPHATTESIDPTKLRELDSAMGDAIDFVDHGYAAGDGGGGTITLHVDSGRLTLDSYRNVVVRDPELTDFVL